MLKTKHLLAVYVSALAVLFCSVTLSMILTELESTQIERDAREINVSGRQRMLSQRIVYLSQDLLLIGDDRGVDSTAARNAILEDLKASIDTFETSHLALSNSARIDPSVHLLFLAERGGESLDARIEAFIAEARHILENPIDAATFDRLKSLERNGLLKDLDAVVRGIETVSVQRVGMLRTLERYSIVLAIVIILVELLFVFVPGHRLIQKTLAQLEERNLKLDIAHQSLNAQNEILKDKNLQIETDSERLRAAWEESEALRKEQSDFTYSVSHDLKSPTNTMHLFLDEISADHSTGLDDSGREMLGMALHTARRMGQLIEDVLKYSWATEEQAEPVTVDMQVCLDGVLSDLVSDVIWSGARIEAGALAPVYGYPMQLRILLQNLISNAIKFRSGDTPPNIFVSCEALPDGLGTVLRVKDNGIGIAPENQQRIFGMFQRLHVRSDYPGTGIGLATCLRIARNHNGRINIASELGRGSTFEVVLLGARRRGSPDRLQAAA